MEADLIGDLLDDLDGDAGGVLDPLGGLGAVGEGEFDEGEGLSRRLEQWDGTVAILDVGRVGLDDQGAAIGATMAWRFLPLIFLPAS